MQTITRKTATALNTESVSILTQQFEIQENENGEITETQIGSNHRCAYLNTESGRASLIANEPEEIITEVITVWGDTPTVEEPVFDNTHTPEPTTEELFNALLGLEE